MAARLESISLSRCRISTRERRVELGEPRLRSRAPSAAASAHLAARAAAVEERPADVDARVPRLRATRPARGKMRGFGLRVVDAAADADRRLRAGRGRACRARRRRSTRLTSAARSGRCRRASSTSASSDARPRRRRIQCGTPAAIARAGRRADRRASSASATSRAAARLDREHPLPRFLRLDASARRSAGPARRRAGCARRAGARRRAPRDSSTTRSDSAAVTSAQYARVISSADRRARPSISSADAAASIARGALERVEAAARVDRPLQVEPRAVVVGNVGIDDAQLVVRRAGCRTARRDWCACSRPAPRSAGSVAACRCVDAGVGRVAARDRFRQPMARLEAAARSRRRSVSRSGAASAGWAMRARRTAGTARTDSRRAMHGFHEVASSMSRAMKTSSSDVAIGRTLATVKPGRARALRDGARRPPRRPSIHPDVRPLAEHLHVGHAGNARRGRPARGGGRRR